LSDGGSQRGKVGKFFFVPQPVQEFGPHEFTVSVHRGIEQMDFEQDATGVLNSRTHAQAGDAG